MPLIVDTLNIYNRLKSTGLSEESAGTIAEIFREAIEENLANKGDLKTTESNLTKYIESVRTELKKDMEVLRTELKKDMEVLRAEIKTEIAESRASTIKWVAGMLVAQTALIATLVKLL